MAKSKATSTSKEKVTGLIYVFFLFLITTGICAYVLFVYNSDYHFANGKMEALSKLERVTSFRKAQEEYFSKVESINDHVSRINPEVNATYEKQELKYLLGEVKKISEVNKYDSRYAIFDYVAEFFEMKLFDRERLGATRYNIDKFKVALDKCRAGVESLKNN